MSNKEEKSIIVKKDDDVGLALGRTHNLLGLTKKILGNSPAVRSTALAPDSPPYGKEFRDEITGMEFVWIEGGSFEMGDVLGDHKEDDWMKDSLPVHRVTLQGFYMARYAVTQGQWQKIMGDNPSYFKKGDNYPVENVSWDDTQEFINKLNKQSGRNYSLPSEAQWEYAARERGKKVRFGNGKDIIDPAEANFDSSEEYQEWYSRAGEYRESTVPVDSFSPNALGLYNMSGNVWEWCQDIWHDNYEGAPTDGSAWETGGEGSLRLVRGGGWDVYPWWLRAAYRLGYRAVLRGNYLGFRLSQVQHR